jgi:hypothetical protein
METGVATGLLHQPDEVAGDAFGLELGGQVDVEDDDSAVCRERRRSCRVGGDEPQRVLAVTQFDATCRHDAGVGVLRPLAPS